MKQSISSVWLLSLILIFILIFACYITITINYSTSFKLKNEVLTIIQKHHGLTDNPGSPVESTIGGGTVTGNVGAFQTINLYLRGNAYTAQGYCPTTDGTWYGVSGIYDGALGEGTIEQAQSTTKYYYCIAKYDTDVKGKKDHIVYYKVRLFYKFEIPVLSEFLAVKVEGMTDEIFNKRTDPEYDTLVSSGSDFFGGN